MAFCTSAPRFALKPVSFNTFPAQFPDNTLRPEFTVSAGVRAGLTVIEAFLTISNIHFIAIYPGFTVWMKLAIHVITSQGFPGDPPGSGDEEDDGCHEIEHHESKM